MTNRDQRISVYLSNEQMDALRRTAAMSFRTVHQQAVFLINEGLIGTGFLPPPPDVPFPEEEKDVP